MPACSPDVLEMKLKRDFGMYWHVSELDNKLSKWKETIRCTK